MYATAIAYEQALYRQLYADPDHEESELARVMERFARSPPTATRRWPPSRR